MISDKMNYVLLSSVACYFGWIFFFYPEVCLEISPELLLLLLFLVKKIILKKKALYSNKEGS